MNEHAAIINATVVHEKHIGFRWIERLRLYLIIQMKFTPGIVF